MIIYDIDNQLDKADAEMVKYETNLINVKKEKREILKTCNDIMERSKKAANMTNTITNNKTNTSNTFKPKPFKPQPELNACDKSLCKELRKIIKLGNIPDKHLINALEMFEDNHKTTDIISLLITDQGNDSKKIQLFIPGSN